MEFWLSCLCFVARRLVRRIEADRNSFSVYIGGTDWVLELNRIPRPKRKLAARRHKSRLPSGTVVPFVPETEPQLPYDGGRQLEPGNDWTGKAQSG